MDDSSSSLELVLSSASEERKKLEVILKLIHNISFLSEDDALLICKIFIEQASLESHPEVAVKSNIFTFRFFFIIGLSINLMQSISRLELFSLLNLESLYH